MSIIFVSSVFYRHHDHHKYFGFGVNVDKTKYKKMT
jgi:hypothetical protein